MRGHCARATLCAGAEITFWISGPATSLASTTAHLDQMAKATHWMADVAPDEPIGMAKVGHVHAQFSVVLPGCGSLQITRGCGRAPP